MFWIFLKNSATDYWESPVCIKNVMKTLDWHAMAFLKKYMNCKNLKINKSGIFKSVVWDFFSSFLSKKVSNNRIKNKHL